MENHIKIINRFSKLDKAAKINWLKENFVSDEVDISDIINKYVIDEGDIQKLHDQFSENTIGNFVMPYGIAPNFIIDGTTYAVPMVIEESSVVAAASSAAKFWSTRGGFHTQILNTQKVGHISFRWTGSDLLLFDHFEKMQSYLIEDSKSITANMEKRGGGLLSMELIQVNNLDEIYQIRAYFNTCDSMGANFINTILETYESSMEIYFDEFLSPYGNLEIIMSILSNYTPECIVRAWVECPVDQLNISNQNDEDILVLAQRFLTAVRIAEEDTYRATTHNKGIYNGIDAVVLATGNDFRAIEASGHAYASRSGHYRSLSTCKIEDGIFKFQLDVPLALGTVGGLTSLHPIAKLSLQILGNPSAEKLMSIIASVGLAQNFAAIRSLVTTGIQKGHMKMHLQNMLIHIGANEIQKEKAITYFSDKIVSYNALRDYIKSLV